MKGKVLKGPPKRRPPLCPPTMKLKGVEDVLGKGFQALFGEAPTDAEYKVGDVVEAVWEEDDVYYVAKIIRCHSDQTFDVVFEEYQNEQCRTPKDWIRPLTPQEVLTQLGFDNEKFSESATIDAQVLFFLFFFLFSFSFSSPSFLR
jgi:hypothetical protein